MVRMLWGIRATLHRRFDYGSLTLDEKSSALYDTLGLRESVTGRRLYKTPGWFECLGTFALLRPRYVIELRMLLSEGPSLYIGRSGCRAAA